MCSLSLSPSPFVFLIVRACLRVYLCASKVEGGGPPPPQPQPPAHPTRQYQTRGLVWPATSAVRGTVDYRASVRASPLYPRTVPWLHLSIRTARRRCGRPKRKEHYRKAGTLARSSLRPACPPLRALHLPHFFRTLPAAPCCTWPSRLHSQFLHPAVCTHPGHPAPCNPASPFRIAAPCPSRRHYPRSWHASTSTESSTVPHYDCMPQYGYSAWTWDRAWPSPPLTVEGQSRSPLPCPSSVSAMTIPLSDPDQAQHRGRPASHPSIHPSIDSVPRRPPTSARRRAP